MITVGNIFGNNHTVLEETKERNSDNRLLYRCKCSVCGRENWMLSKKSIENGKHIHCGCQNKLEGVLFGKYNNHQVLRETEKRDCTGSKIYICRCGECANDFWELTARRIKYDQPIISCGCLDNFSIANKRHGMSRAKETKKKPKFYSIYTKMCSRCNGKDYELYVNKGIQLCDRWKIFENFKEDMYDSYLEACSKYGESKVSIDRINPNGDYEPNNCRWANTTMQSYNRDFTKHSKTKPILATRIEDGYKIITYNAKVFSRMIFNTPNHHIIDVCKGKRPMEKGWRFEIITDEDYFKLKEEGLDFIENIYIYKLNIPHTIIQEDVSTNIHESQEDYLKSVLHYYINLEGKIVYGSKSEVYAELGFHSKSSMDSNLYKSPNKRVRKLSPEEITLHLQGKQIQF